MVLDRVDASARTTLELSAGVWVRPLGLRAETPKPRAIDCTTRIPDGARLRVDGDAGAVTILEG